MGSPVLTVSGVTKTYGHFTAVNDLSFTVGTGSIFGFLGPNGAGKTTTLRMVLDIIRPTSGDIDVLGAASAQTVRHRIGYLPEERGLYKKMTARQIIAYFAQLKGMPGRIAKDRALDLLTRFGLGEFASTKVDALSKGMAQKVQLLSAIAHDPELIILDEPFSGLDPVNQQVLEDQIRDLAKENRTIIFSTHVMEHAERLCDRLLLIAEGSCRFLGTLAEARAAMPRVVRIESPDSVEAIRALDFVTDIAPSNGPDTPGRWDVQLSQGTDPQQILKACFERGITLRQFDQSDPPLHDIFVHMVGDRAREVHFR